jgi:hypothetical protein
MSSFVSQIERPSPTVQTHVAGHKGYGIADLIRLLKSVPADRNPQLVVQVIRTTLESVGVQSAALIESAAILENGIRDQIATLESQIVDLTREIATRRDRITRLNVELAEMVSARDRLASADLVPENAGSIDPKPPEPGPTSEAIGEIDSSAFDEDRGKRGVATPSPRAPRPKPRSLPPLILPPPPRGKTGAALAEALPRKP